MPVPRAEAPPPAMTVPSSSTSRPTVATTAGTAMLPVPRMTDDRALNTQMITAPANTHPE